MKKLIIILALFFSFVTMSNAAETAAEKPKEPATKIEAFLSKKGEVIIRNFHEVGSHFYPGNMTLKALIIYKPGQEAQKTKGMRIDIKEAGRLDRSNSSFLDIEEIESLQKALVYLEGFTENIKTSEADSTEIMYSTKDDFVIGFFKGRDGELKGFASAGIIGRTTVFFPVEDIKTVRASVEKGLQILKEK